jgi:4-alpha-glucanotransferase
MNLTRSSGILLHPTSLPSGRIGDDAYRFVDWLERAGQSWWQVLPLSPPDETGSPYASPSAFAGWNGLLADPDAPVSSAELEDFVARHPFWIGHWARHVRDSGGGDSAVADQVRFLREWSALKNYANERGVRLLGDMPIYVAAGSADHVAFPELFRTGVAAGVPPDDFSRNGQLWGNPIYDWHAMRQSGFRWWIERLRRTLELVDLTRIDHFRGFVAYWEVPAGRKTARVGRWVRAPGRDLFAALHEALGDLPVVAEDLGVITPPVERLRDEFGFPGMLVIQWGFYAQSSPHALENHEEHRIVYTGTHDSDTFLGWVDTIGPPQRRRLRAELERTGFADDDLHWSAIRYTMSSPAVVSIAPVQDVLGLDNSARMNRPGTSEGNWSWRLAPGQLTDALADRLRAATEEAGRLP